MARLARIVISGVAHHVTQSGNRRLPFFFSDEDRSAYLTLISEACIAQATRCCALGLERCETIDARIRTRRPLATPEWIAQAEGDLERKLGPSKRGPKARKSSG